MLMRALLAESTRAALAIREDGCVKLRSVLRNSDGSHDDKSLKLQHFRIAGAKVSLAQEMLCNDASVGDTNRLLQEDLQCFASLCCS
jgi:hypothetical protein